MPAHPEHIMKLTGVDPYLETEIAVSSAIQLLDVDMLMCSVLSQSSAKSTDQNVFSMNQTSWRNEESTIHDIYSYDPAINRYD